MTAIALTGHQLRYDLLAFRRNRQARFATLLLPPLLLILFVSVGGDGTPADARLYLPGLIALGIISSSLLSLTIELVIQRETGVLKRRRAAAAPAWALIAGRTLTAATISLAVTLLLLIIAGNAYDLEIPTTALPALALFTVAGSAAFAALAYAAATAIRSASAAQPVMQAIALPLYLASGIFVPSTRLPEWLDRLSRILPLEHLAHGLRHALSAPTPGIDAADLLVITAWGLVGLALALRRFSWLPRS
jgi:ABC-2 type transport system permease protein